LGVWFENRDSKSFVTREKAQKRRDSFRVGQKGGGRGVAAEKGKIVYRLKRAAEQKKLGGACSNWKKR